MAFDFDEFAKEQSAQSTPNTTTNNQATGFDFDEFVSSSQSTSTQTTPAQSTPTQSVPTTKPTTFKAKAASKNVTNPISNTVNQPEEDNTEYISNIMNPYKMAVDDNGNYTFTTGVNKNKQNNSLNKNDYHVKGKGILGGLYNLGRDALGVGKGIVTGLPNMAKGLWNSAQAQAAEIPNMEHPWKQQANATAHGLVNGIAALGEIPNIIPAVISSYKGEEYKPWIKMPSDVIQATKHKLVLNDWNNGKITDQEKQDKLAQINKVNKELEQAGFSHQMGDMSSVAIPMEIVGNAGKLAVKSYKLGKVGKAAKATQQLVDEAKAYKNLAEASDKIEDIEKFWNADEKAITAQKDLDNLVNKTRNELNRKPTYLEDIAKAGITQALLTPGNLNEKAQGFGTGAVFGGVLGGVGRGAGKVIEASKTNPRVGIGDIKGETQPVEQAPIEEPKQPVEDLSNWKPNETMSSEESNAIAQQFENNLEKESLARQLHEELYNKAINQYGSLENLKAQATADFKAGVKSDAVTLYQGLVEAENLFNKSNNYIKTSGKPSVTEGGTEFEKVEQDPTKYIEENPGDELSQTNPEGSQYGVEDINTENNKAIAEQINNNVRYDQMVQNEYKAAYNNVIQKYGSIKKLRKIYIRDWQRKIQTGETSEALQDYMNLQKLENEYNNAKYVNNGEPYKYANAGTESVKTGRHIPQNKNVFSNKASDVKETPRQIPNKSNVVTEPEVQPSNFGTTKIDTSANEMLARNMKERLDLDESTQSTKPIKVEQDLNRNVEESNYSQLEQQAKARLKELEDIRQTRQLTGKESVEYKNLRKAYGENSPQGTVEGSNLNENTTTGINTPKATETPQNGPSTVTEKPVIEEKTVNSEQAQTETHNIAKDYISNTQTKKFDVSRQLNEFINVTKTYAKELGVSDKNLREILPFLRERTELPPTLAKARPELQAVWDKVNNSVGMKQVLTKLADDTSKAVEDVHYQNYLDSKAKATNVEEDFPGVENHISHIWEKDVPQGNRNITNTTNSKFGKQRTVSSLYQGIEELGLTPKTLDYADILRQSTSNMIDATEKKILVDRLRALRDEDGNPLATSADTGAGSDWHQYMLGGGNLKVRPDIAKNVYPILGEVAKQGFFGKTLDFVNNFAKQFELGFSGFHHIALGESMIGNMGLGEYLTTAGNWKSAWEQLSSGNYEIFKNPELSRRAIKAGVELGTPLDIDTGMLEGFADRLSNLVEKAGNKVGGRVTGKVASAPFKALSAAQKVNNNYLWNVIHNSFKLKTFEKLINEADKEYNGNVPREVEESIAQWVNDSFGGQNFARLGFGKNAKRMSNRVLLSTDWNLSAARQFVSMFQSKTTQKFINSLRNQGAFESFLRKHNIKAADILKGSKEKLANFTKKAGISNLDSNVEAAGKAGKIARDFWVRAGIYNLVVLPNILNVMTTEYDRKKNPEFYQDEKTTKDRIKQDTIWGHTTDSDTTLDKVMPKVFLGRNKKGQARYVRMGKQFREVPEFLENPIERFGSKSSPLLSGASELATGYSNVTSNITGKGFRNRDYTYQDKDMQYKLRGLDDKKRKQAMVATLKNKVKPMSFNAISEAEENGKGISTMRYFLPVSKGYTPYKLEERYEKIIDSKASAARKKKLIANLDKQAMYDGMTREEIKAAKEKSEKYTNWVINSSLKETAGNTPATERTKKELTDKGFNASQVRKAERKERRKAWKNRFKK